MYFLRGNDDDDDDEGGEVRFRDVVSRVRACVQRRIASRARDVVWCGVMNIYTSTSMRECMRAHRVGFYGRGGRRRRRTDG